MNREIKFRIKHNGEWYYGTPLTVIKTTDKLCAFQGINSNGKDLCSMSLKTDTLGQFTGLCDKNGKEIYEGDIVQDMRIYIAHLNYVERGKETIEQANEYKNYGDITVVKFCTKDVASCGCCYDYFIGSGFKANLVDLTCCKIIGNIYDNPELLKGE